jgi:carbamoyl-phosphate synthase large subunit
MPKRTDLKRIMIIGSGPIVIGQAAEFDFSGSQACKSVREEDYEVILVNSNPATIQTDIEMADRVYCEPLTVPVVEKIIAKERPQGILSGMGGQTALNICSELASQGILKKYNVELLGTPLEAIEKSEDRELFKQTMISIGEPVPKSGAAHSIEEAKAVVKNVVGKFPVIVRAGFTLGGLGSGFAHDEAELEEIVGKGLVYSRIRQVLIEESILGWKEFEYEVMRDADNNCITICNMENIDPMGVHTGESIVVAPAQTLSDREHQTLRSAALKIIRALGIQGGCNVQFAVHPQRFEYRVIEVNPRVSRSSALASKATGYPIARVAAKIALGMRLHEIRNDVTGQTPASFEPAIDYVITKIPRWPFDKFRTADKHLGTGMKSTGEVMAIGKTIEESLQKAVRSLEVDRNSLLAKKEWTDEQLTDIMIRPTHQRLFVVAEAIRRGRTSQEIVNLTAYDPFFVQKIRQIVEFEPVLAKAGLKISRDTLLKAKTMGFSDEFLAEIWQTEEEDVRALRAKHGVRPEFKMVDTCSAEFSARTPYYYSTYSPDLKGLDEVQPTDRKKCVVLGSGPIRIGQGVEFDYCCVHAVYALRAAGVEAIIINNNPETVSTDYDTSDRLYFEPLTLENVLDIIEKENPDGVLVQFGGQTAINLAAPIKEALDRRPHLKTKIWGTPPEAIDLAENRDHFNELCKQIKVPKPDAGIAYNAEEARGVARRIGYPVLCRPSYVLGGRAMQVVGSDAELEEYVHEAVKVSKDQPLLIDDFISNAIEVDVDAVCDGDEVYIGAIMEHIEEAGVHSGDSTCTIPPPSLSPEIQRTLELYTKKIALALGVRGLVNVQYAVKDGIVYCFEANPRSSRTVPFVAKATGVPLAKIAAKVAMGETLKSMGLPTQRPKHYAVKAPVFPFLKLQGVDTVLGPEMKSTGEVIGIDDDYGRAFYKAMEAAGNRLPREGSVFISMRDEDKRRILPIASELVDLGFKLYATRGTAQYLREFGIASEMVYKVGEKGSPDAIDLMRRGAIQLVINTPSDNLEAPARRDGYMMRRVATDLQIPFVATIEAARAAVGAIAALQKGEVTIKSLQEYHGMTGPIPKPQKRVATPPLSSRGR